MVAVLSFAVVHQISGALNLQQKSSKLATQSGSRHRGLQIGYVLVLIVTAVLWVVLAAVSTFSIGHTLEGNVFMCDFKVGDMEILW